MNDNEPNVGYTKNNNTTENRLIPITLLTDSLIERLLEKWVVDFGYTNSLNDDCALLICKQSEL